MGEYMDKWLPEMKKNSRTILQPGPGATPTRNTLTHSSELFSEILKVRNVSQLPRTPEEIEQARANLKAAQSFKCPICWDSRFVHPVQEDGKPDYTRVVSCRCVQREANETRKKALLAYCELPPEGLEMTFENFRRTPGTEEAYQACLAMAEERFDKLRITLMGHTGRGKTHLAIAVVNRWLQKGKPAKYIYVPNMLDELREGFEKEGDESYYSRYQTFLTVPMLVMDDLGTENPTAWVQERLDTIYNTRLMNRLPTITTTNKPFDKLPFRIASRLKRDGVIIPVTGPEYQK